MKKCCFISDCNRFDGETYVGMIGFAYVYLNIYLKNQQPLNFYFHHLDDFDDIARFAISALRSRYDLTRTYYTCNSLHLSKFETQMWQELAEVYDVSEYREVKASGLKRGEVLLNLVEKCDFIFCFNLNNNSIETEIMKTAEQDKSKTVVKMQDFINIEEEIFPYFNIGLGAMTKISFNKNT